MDWRVDVNTLMIDLPRHAEGKMSYGAIEDIKNGYITNFKYETGSKTFNPPHVVIFSNHEPYDTSSFSIDRWKIYNIVNNDIEL